MDPPNKKSFQPRQFSLQALRLNQLTMKATELIKKLGKLLGKKGNTPATVHAPPEAKAPAVRLLDRLGVIQLHPNWRN
jgi:hypothetical protein